MPLSAEQGAVSFDAPDELWERCLVLFYEGLSDGAGGVFVSKDQIGHLTWVRATPR